MVKTLTKVGNSYALMFDSTLRELSGLKPGDQVNVTVHDGGAIVLTPMTPVIDVKEAEALAEKLIRKNSELFRRLA
jgi:antitoxin component of MazEF toxin-antitoxin module